MFMGSLLIICGCLLYWLVKPPASQDFILEEEVAIPTKAALDGEARLDV